MRRLVLGTAIEILIASTGVKAADLAYPPPIAAPPEYEVPPRVLVVPPPAAVPRCYGAPVSPLGVVVMASYRQPEWPLCRGEHALKLGLAARAVRRGVHIVC